MIPNAAQIARLLTGLLGKPVQVKIAKSAGVFSQATLYWGLYVDQQLQIRWICSCDLTCAANAAAALSVFPPARVKENITAGKLEPVLEENLSEVLNILTQMFNVSGQTHLRYHRMLVQGQVPVEIHQGLQSHTTLADFDVTVSGYGGGRMSFAQMPALSPDAAEILLASRENRTEN